MEPSEVPRKIPQPDLFIDTLVVSLGLSHTTIEDREGKE